jgi:hypothetical protein
MVMDAPKLVQPPGFQSWNRALQGAYKKGWQAFFNSKDEGDCPYRDKRKDCGRLTWSRSFIAAWQDGFADARKSAVITDYYSNTRRAKIIKKS